MRRNDAIRTIKERLSMVDIVRRYVALKRNGPRWVAPCPFHQETKPSFSVNEQEGLFYCFGCQASGDLFTFYEKINGLDFKETLEQLALEAGVTLDAHASGQSDGGQKAQQARGARQQMLRMYTLAAAHFAANLRGPAGAACREYLDGRGIPADMIERFGLGYSLPDWQPLTNALRRAGFDEAQAVTAGLLGKSAKEGSGGASGRAYDRFRGRLMFPIHSLSQQVIAFGGRIIENTDEAKYINSADSPIYKKGEHLYGLAQARRSITVKRTALLTEGYLDVLTLHQFGYENAVGVLGTALTKTGAVGGVLTETERQAQVKKLASFASHFVLLFDGDRAGRKAALRACEMLLVLGLSCNIVLMPEGEDIDSLLRTRGTEAFEALLVSAPEGLQFCTDTVRMLAPRDVVDWARDFLKQVTLPELISPFVTRLATRLNLAEDMLRKGLPQVRQTQQAQQAMRQRHIPSHTHTAPQSGANGTRIERETLSFAVRYPHRLNELCDTGADLAIVTDMGRALWTKLERYAPEDILTHLTDSEKHFWTVCRIGETAPLDNGDKELEALRHFMTIHDGIVQKKSIAAGLRENAHKDNFDAEREHLHAVNKSIRGNDE